MIELAIRLLIFKSDSDMQNVYNAITNPEAVVPYVSQPFLNYINTPGLHDSRGNFEVNKMGIRYPREIELTKPEQTLRILFLGGSTTFGEIELDHDAFPGMVEKILRTEFLPAQDKYTDIECLNGGVHGLTSAEILNHYQFKYQYIQPDIVVIHTGVNDAFAYAQIYGSTYQPDYHNSRRVYYDPQLPTCFERKLFLSKAYALYFIKSRLKHFLKNTLEDNIFYLHTNDKIWFEPGNSAITDTTFNAFYNNMKTLVSVANRRGADVLFVPEVIDTTKMPAELGLKLLEGLELNKGMINKIVASHQNTFVRLLPEHKFSKDHFMLTDGIHTNEKGEELKARSISDFLKELPKQ